MALLLATLVANAALVLGSCGWEHGGESPGWTSCALKLWSLSEDLAKHTQCGATQAWALPAPHCSSLGTIPPCSLPKGQSVPPHCCLSPSPPLLSPACTTVLLRALGILQISLLVPHWTLPYAVCVMYFKLSRQAGRVIKCEVFRDEMH